MKRLIMLIRLVLLASTAVAAVPQLINFQGILKDGSGNPVADGSYSVTFTIYDAPAGGSVQWAETTSVTTSTGLFTVLLGALNPVPDSGFNNPNRWLGIKVGADAEMTPRQQLVSVGYAYESAQWNSVGQDLSRVNGNVGIGISGPQAKLHVSGASEGLRIQGSDVGNPNGAYASFHDAAGTPLGYVGDGSSGNQDMYLTSYVGNVHLYTPAGAALTAGSDGTVGIGTTIPSYPLDVHRTGTDWTGRFQNTTNNARAYFSNGSGYGAFIDAGSNAGSGTYALNVNKSGAPYLYVRGDGRVGVGTAVPVSALHVQVDGAATATGAAIRGHNTPSSGVYFGVYGINDSPNGYGVFSSGNFAATGSKGFRIDHPQDPTQVYLLHYSAESPDVLNMYTGNVVTDGNGYARITLPEYFEEINKEPRYTLTVINEGGTEFIQTMVVEEIRSNQFAIRTSKPSVKVSWRVDALRNDPWVRAYGAPVQVEKQGFERGKYQHPELYGKPKEMGINYRPDADIPAPEPSRESAGEVQK